MSAKLIAPCGLYCGWCPKFPCQKLYKMYSNMDKFFDDIKEAFPKGVRKN